MDFEEVRVLAHLPKMHKVINHFHLEDKRFKIYFKCPLCNKAENCKCYNNSTYYCHVCKKGGDALTLIRTFIPNYREALELLKELYD